MAPRRPRPRRFLVPLVLAAILAGEITGIALARTFGPVALEPGAPDAPDAPGVQVGTRAVGADSAVGAVSARQADLPDAGRDAIASAANMQRARSAQRGAPPAIAPVSPVRSVAGPAGGSAATARTQSSPTYRGRNHVWIPSLGIDKVVQSFPCSRSRPPDAGVYRWGCAGRNNVYLLGHAWSTFKPLHDAYVRGRLAKGMRVMYADGAGTVHTYSVIWWKVTAPTTAASWAWAAQSRPSMTLQTCVGSRGQDRLMVRLVRIA